MRFLAIVLLTASLAGAQTIETRALNPKVPMVVMLNPAVATTLLFPSPLGGTFGLGLASAQNPNGLVQLDHPDGSGLLILHALTPSARVILTVLMDATLYVFDLQAGPSPDIALTFTKADAAAPRAKELTPEEIAAQRPKYDPEILLGLLRRGRDAAILRPLYPDLYQGFVAKDVHYTSENDTWKTTVASILRFGKEDAVVLRGTVENKQDTPLVFDGRAATVLVSNEVHPVKLLDCLRPIPPHRTVPIDVVIQGDIDGGRANLSAENTYRIELPMESGNVWSLKNGSQPARPFTVPAPLQPSPPLTQTSVQKEGK
jgi:hypothetical protein